MKIIRSLFFFLSFSLTFSFCFGLEKLWYLKNEPRSMESFEKNIKKIDIVGPQTYYLLANGEVRSVFPDKILQLKNEKNPSLKVMPLLANITFYKDKNGNQKEYFDQKMIKDLLDSQNNWQKVSDYLRTEAKKNNFYGWQMDLENVPVTYKDKFSDFTKFLKTELEKDNLKLSLAIVSKISDRPSDYKSDYWQNWAGAYDWKVLSENSDFLSIMAYDQPDSPGPVATVGWSKKVLDYALKNVPKEKISFGIPVYSWVYRAKEKKHFSMIDYGLVIKKLSKPLLTSPYIRGGKDGTTGKGTSKYWGNISWVSYNYLGKNYTIWYEDKNSFQTKYEQIKNAGVGGFSVWVLGDEDPKIWEIF